MADNTYNPKDPDTAYLRPKTSNRDADMIRSVEEAGMVIDHTKYIAMYLHKSGGAAGPQGPPGEDENSKYDTIIASCSDETTPLTIGGPKTTFRAPYPLDLTNGYVRASLTTAPVGSAIIVRLTVNGNNLFTTDIRIDDGSRTSVGSLVPSVIDPNELLVADDAEFLVFIDQVGSTYAGAGLKVAVTGIKVAP
jgi:hypothetical protein